MHLYNISRELTRITKNDTSKAFVFLSFLFVAFEFHDVTAKLLTSV
jgi:hypothetical protein